MKNKHVYNFYIKWNGEYLVHTVHNDFIIIGALNTDDSEAIQSILSHRAPKISLQAPDSTERAVL